MKQKVLETIKKYNLIENGDKLVLGVSGGPDSISMLNVLNEIKALKAACGNKILKVIIETCLLTDEEKITMCKLVTEAGADFIKTSTGFSKGGATFADVELFAKNVGPNVKIKAAGGIHSLEDAQHFLDLGASRLGTSALVKIAKEKM